MKFGDIGTHDRTHAESRAAEHGVDPLPLPDGPLDPLWRAWTLLVTMPAAFLLMALTLVQAVPLSLVLPVERFQRWGPHQLLGLLTFAALGPVRVQRHPGFRRDGSYLVCMNHTSMLDPFVAARAIPLPLCGIHHAHHFDVPFYGRLMRLSNGIGVQRGGSGQTEAVREAVLDRAARGISILTLPEGRRTQNGRILPLRRGVLRIARDAGLPVVPVAVRGLWRVLRRGCSVVRPGWVDVYIGAPIPTEGLDDAQLDELAVRMRAFMVAWAEEGELLDPTLVDPRRDPA